MKFAALPRYLFVLAAVGVGATMAVITAYHSALNVALELGGQQGSGAEGGRFTFWFLGPILWVIFTLAGVAAWKKCWRGVALACWFLIGPAAEDIVSIGWHTGWASALLSTELQTMSFYILVLGIGLTIANKPAAQASSSMTARAALILALGVAAGYLWRGIAESMDPETLVALSYWGDLSNPVREDAVHAFLSCATDLAAGLALGAGVFCWLRGRADVLSAALAFSAGMAFSNFLGVFDVMIGDVELGYLMANVPDAAAFMACVAALVLSTRRLTPAP